MPALGSMYDEKKDDGGWATAGGSSAAAATKRKISKQKKAGKNVKVTGDTLRACTRLRCSLTNTTTASVHQVNGSIDDDAKRKLPYWQQSAMGLLKEDQDAAAVPAEAEDPDGGAWATVSSSGKAEMNSKQRREQARKDKQAEHKQAEALRLAAQAEADALADARAEAADAESEARRDVRKAVEAAAAEAAAAKREQGASSEAAGAKAKKETSSGGFGDVVMFLLFLTAAVGMCVQQLIMRHNVDHADAPMDLSAAFSSQGVEALMPYVVQDVAELRKWVTQFAQAAIQKAHEFKHEFLTSEIQPAAAGSRK
jgi:hypothetical protein